MVRLLALFGLVAVCGTALASCGGDEADTATPPVASGNPPSAALPAGCQPGQAYERLEGLTRAIGDADRDEVLRYVAPAEELRRFVFTYANSPGESRATATTPSEVYVQFMRLARGRKLEVIAVATGPNAPLPVPGVEGAGTEFILTIGDSFGTGKSGLDCETGRFYMWAIQVDTSLHDQLICKGEPVVTEERIDQHRDDPLVCRI
jgi:hypothetical protein